MCIRDRSRTGAYASIRYKKGYQVPVGIWEITTSNEKSLDFYEGYPVFYQKKNIYVYLEDGSQLKAMVYLSLIHISSRGGCSGFGRIPDT